MNTPDAHQDFEEQLRTAVQVAELPSLLPAVAYLTGDQTILRDELRPGVHPIPLGLEPQGGLSALAQDLGRTLAFEALRDWHGAGRPAAPAYAPEELRPLMEFVTGPVDTDYLSLFLGQLGFGDTDSAWTLEQVRSDRDFHVVVIGAGMSGLAAAHRLADAGVSFTVLERNDDVGGVWLENTYPGCQLDTSNFCYSYSFAQHAGWRYQYSRRDSILEYFQNFADQQSLRSHVRFRQTVERAQFDEGPGLWRLTVRDTTAEPAKIEVIEAHAVISAVGQLNTPAYPSVPGLDSFDGDSWHTARWNHDVDLTGKRVAVIGTGASSFQVVPEIVDAAAEVVLFQRTPPWIMPTPNYHAELPAGLRWLLREVPGYHRWFRFLQFWVGVEGRRRYAVVDPQWDTPGSISRDNQALRQALEEHLSREFEDRPDLLPHVIPDYPPYAKRMLRDDGRWAATLKRDDVRVVIQPITGVVSRGIDTADGASHEVDVIIYGTGFRASEFLAPMEVVGRGGLRLHDFWGGEPRANVGVAVPNFPNLFLLYGPNTNLVVNGSIVLFSEAEVDYVMACLRTLLEADARTIDCKSEALDRFYERVDEASAAMAFGVDGVSSWYKSASGRVSQNWPLSTFEFWQRTRGPEPDEYVLGSSGR
ncbi:NAD(P)/FAD-dependent oxidoreductase [Rhodococcus oxybenzonivorans]|uniref:flavin-containing monooxygenase n=1 Tax=Rhodococcus oxybenzonivorans TaxID=1990687 RepID=UPI0029544ED1|nr:NAD(P)/FAD-dependent oxidoreductase [Rhodococcus oxybenzonivorans]MDV7352744.1 NAD(P)/FAD-dependent oxidoreductase [Rhodococcus oxybenzonivorans]